CRGVKTRVRIDGYRSMASSGRKLNLGSRNLNIPHLRGDSQIWLVERLHNSLRCFCIRANARPSR
ncbi:hypothetical protein L9F63_003549, partial [Diploptera punctata]